MNRLYWYLSGYWMLEITGASPEWVLNGLTEKRIPFWSLNWLDEFTVQLCVFRRDLDAVENTVQRAQCEMKRASGIGAFYFFWNILRRPVLWISVLFCVLVLSVLPKFLLFYSVSGNETVEDAAILRALEELDIGFGTYGPSIKPKWIKDHVLNMLPELQWITVTQNGCMATVEVRERPEAPQTLERRGYANVIAAQSGLITKQSVLAGQALKQPGDFVLEGETLVSGLVDLERVYTIEYAQAEIYARTWRKKQVVTPSQHLEKAQTGETRVCIWLEVGKERIKIFGNSGISTSACDKMIKRKILSLPGDLELPVSLLVETFHVCELQAVETEPEFARMFMEQYAEEAAQFSMQAGEILQHDTSLVLKEDRFCLTSVLECHEMIAETVEAKWNEEDFQHDGKNG